MNRRILVVMAIAASCGVALGFGARLLSSRANQASAGSVRDGGLTPAAESGSGQEGAGEAASAVPTLEDLSGASRSEFRLLLVKYLMAAKLDDLKALHSPEWRKIPGWSKNLNLIDLRAVELDAPAWIDWIRHSEEMWDIRRMRLQQASIAWARVDPGPAFAAATELSDHARNMMAHSLSSWDRDEAIEILKDHMPESSMLPWFEAQRLEQLAVVDAAGALDAALALQASGGGSEGLAMILNNWAAADPATAFEWLREQDGVRDFEKLAGGIIVALADSNPAVAMEKLATLPDNIARVQLEGEVAEARARKDLGGTVEWVLGQSDPARRNFLFGRISSHLAAEDPRKLLELMREHRIPMNAQNAGSYNMSWEGHSRGMGNDQEVSAIMHKAVMEVAEDDPAAALAYSVILDSGFPSSLEPITALWAAEDAAGAATSAADLPQGRLRQMLEGNAIRALADQSPQSAAAILSQGSSAVDPDLAVFVAEKWAALDSAAAAAWAATIPDEELRQRLRTELRERSAEGQP